MNLDRLLDFSTLTQVPVLVWGPPGVGKSAAIQAWAARRQRACWTVIASLREPADFGGLPVVGASGRDGFPAVTFAPPRFAVEASERGGVIFLDELTTAPPAVQAALLRAVLDKAFGDLSLDPSKVLIVAAANPPEFAAGGWDLAPPLANRFAHHEWTLDPRAWCEAFPGYWGAAPALGFEGRTLDARAWAQARSLVAAFVRARPTLLLNVPVDESRRGGAWPSPRSWDFLSRLRAVAGSLDAGELLPLLAGCVGEGAALEFGQWMRELDLPDPEELLTHPDHYRHPERGDLAFAVLSSVCQAALGDLTPKRWSAAWKIFATAASEGGADVAAVAVRQLARAHKEDLPLPARQIAPFLPILRAAGLMGGK